MKGSEPALLMSPDDVAVQQQRSQTDWDELCGHTLQIEKKTMFTPLDDSSGQRAGILNAISPITVTLTNVKRITKHAGSC